MNRFHKKLRSRTGASITYALLLFLVCAVLCAVIITASTAAAGRMSGVAESDQRYYSVTSAGELMKSMLEGKTVYVVKVTTRYVTMPYKDDAADGENKTETELPTETYLVVLDANEEFSDACLTPQAMITGVSTVQKDSLLNDAAYHYFQHLTISSRTLTLSSDVPKPEGSDKDPLAVTMLEELDANGNLTLTLYNTNGDPFKQELLFGADTARTTSEKTEVGAPENYVETEAMEGEPAVAVVHRSYTVTTKTTVFEIISVTWTLTSIKTLTA